mgnify:FL=1
MNIVFLDADTVGPSAAIERIARMGSFTAYPRTSPSQAPERVADADIVITNKVVFDRALIDAAPRLKLICVTATGVNNIDLDYAAARGVTVKNVDDYSTESVAQTTFMHIFSLVCHSRQWDSFVKDGSWSRSGLFTDISLRWNELGSLRMGIIGMGRIGRRVATLAKAFSMDVVYYSTSGTNHCTDYPALPLDELLRTSDIVSIHAPLTAATANLIGLDQLKKMKPDAFIINVGRGGIICEADLATALDGGIMAGAALDVFTREPMPEDHPLLHLGHPERIRFSPHIAWTSNQAMDTLMERTERNIAEFLEQ